MFERRSKFRELTCIPATYEEPDDPEDHIALLHDASTTGATLYARERLEIGEHLGLNLYFGADPDVARPAGATVVHCERRPWERSHVWPWQVGVQFDTPLDSYQDEIHALAQKRRADGIIRS